jgi:selenoprotein W-related protein
MSTILGDASLERQIERFDLVPSDGGKFEFSVDGNLLFSKLETHRHADPNELKELFKEYLAGQ